MSKINKKKTVKHSDFNRKNILHYCAIHEMHLTSIYLIIEKSVSETPQTPPRYGNPSKK